MTTFTQPTHSPYRFDVVGSFLRPEALKEAREKFEKGDISKKELTKVENEAIIDLIQKEEAAGLKAVTDGEFRRSWWHLDFFWGLTGVKKVGLESGYFFNGEETRAETARITGKISGENHPFVDDFKFVKAHASDNVDVKQTIPAPAQFYFEIIRPENIEATKKYYDSREELLDDIASAYKQVINDLYEAGARTIQLDDCTWGTIVSKEFEESRFELAEIFITVNNKATEGLPEDLVINTHVCRGNFHSTWASSGGYDSVATPLFDRGNYNAYFLEYDTERAGGFEPLENVSEGKSVVLGLVTSKDGELEEKEDIKKRIQEASKYVDLDNLYLSPQCGFASTEEGNILTEDQQWNKIKLIKEVAEEVWG